MFGTAQKVHVAAFHWRCCSRICDQQQLASFTCVVFVKAAHERTLTRFAEHGAGIRTRNLRDSEMEESSKTSAPHYITQNPFSMLFAVRTHDPDRWRLDGVELQRWALPL
jgi:hypothetical protein